MEAIISIKKTIANGGVLVPPIHLSEQQLVSCDTGNSGCAGGHTQTAWTYAINTGLNTDADYPYVSGTTATNGTCTFNAADTTKVIKKATS